MLDERRTGVSPLFPGTWIFRFVVLAVAGLVLGRQGFGVPVDVVFWSRLCAEVVRGVEGFLDPRFGEGIRVSRHDYLACVV